MLPLSTMQTEISRLRNQHANQEGLYLKVGEAVVKGALYTFQTQSEIRYGQNKINDSIVETENILKFLSGSLAHDLETLVLASDNKNTRNNKYYWIRPAYILKTVHPYSEEELKDIGQAVIKAITPGTRPQNRTFTQSKMKKGKEKILREKIAREKAHKETLLKERDLITKTLINLYNGHQPTFYTHDIN